ncbi:GNAT family N-acetyltransferase [Brevibacillus sp. SYP-B805]|nr:GNAT family N-acetyltransferase [Brevibacillus sp. SYP-B805]
MDLLTAAHEADLAYKRSFACCEERAWGHLFWNTDNPTYYDANHADILNLPPAHTMSAIIAEVIRFYREKGIIPRFYLYQTEKLQPFIDQLAAAGFAYEPFDMPVQQWSGTLASVAQHPDIAIERVTDGNYQDALLVECSIQEFGGKEVREKAFETEFAQSAFCHYLLRWRGEPVSVAAIFTHGGHMRVESVATLEAYRGQGLIGHLLRHIQQEFVRQGGKALWVYPVNQTVEKVYQKYGFHTVGSLTVGHAYLEGKGIKEIRGE